MTKRQINSRIHLKVLNNKGNLYTGIDYFCYNLSVKMKFKLLLFVFVFFQVHFKVSAQDPATEVRAVWLTTIWNLDWPSPNLNMEGQKAQLKAKLDELRAANFNTVFFQTRLRGDVLYDSNIEPRSRFVKSGFDPLAFAVEECHKRGLECHAWFVTFPVGTKKYVTSLGKQSVVKKRPELCKLHDGEWYLDPGNPATRGYLLSLVDEIVRKYDIDGIHFDYIRYPEKNKNFPDNDTFKKYGKGQSITVWRRNNINTLVSEIYDHVKELKPWVQVSSSPVGKYKNLNYNHGTWTALESVHQDAANWLKSGKHDALYPMMYYTDDHFFPYLEDWIKNCNGRPIVPGLGAYRLIKKEGDWTTKKITDQIEYVRKNQIAGQAFFRAGNILDNLKGIKTLLENNYYRHPAKLPPMTWISSELPAVPAKLEAFFNEKGQLCLQWEANNSTHGQTYTVYYSETPGIDTDNARNIISTGLHSNKIVLNVARGDFGFYYGISASNRFHNESGICSPAFVVHTEYEK